MTDFHTYPDPTDHHDYSHDSGPDPHDGAYDPGSDPLDFGDHPGHTDYGDAAGFHADHQDPISGWEHGPGDLHSALDSGHPTNSDHSPGDHHPPGDFDGHAHPDAGWHHDPGFHDPSFHDAAIGAAGYLTTFDPAHADPTHLVGHPAEDMSHWHEQTHQDTCAVASQEFILDDLTGHNFSENQLRQEAIDHGWYTPGGGTSLGDVGKLVEAHGIDMEGHFGSSLADIAQQLAENHKVIAAVNAEDIWNGGHDASLPLASLPGIPGQRPDHAVEVIGIENYGSANPTVILNDPGHPDGKGLEVPAGLFMESFASSNFYMVHTTGRMIESPADLMASQAGMGQYLGGYFNADGTYHWDTDNSNRDDDGTIVSWG